MLGLKRFADTLNGLNVLSYLVWFVFMNLYSYREYADACSLEKSTVQGVPEAVKTHWNEEYSFFHMITSLIWYVFLGIAAIIFCLMCIFANRK